jgi:hypothetical protein
MGEEIRSILSPDMRIHVCSTLHKEVDFSVEEVQIFGTDRTENWTQISHHKRLENMSTDDTKATGFDGYQRGFE